MSTPKKDPKDSRVVPPELHDFLRRVIESYTAEKANDQDLPDLEVTDDRSGLRIRGKKTAENAANCVPGERSNSAACPNCYE